MKTRTWAGLLLAVCLVGYAWQAPAATATDDAALFRLFLKDGTTLVSYGEFAHVGDRVVFSMPLGSAEGGPALQLVNIAADRVDWVRTNKYADSARSAHYIATRAEGDYVALSNEVARTLNEVSQAPDAAKKLTLVQNARKALADWPRDHFNYRSTEVRQMLTMLDDAIADLRASSSAGAFDLSLTTYAGDPPPVLEPLLPPPTPKEAIEQALFVSRVTESAAEREALLRAALSALDRDAAAVPADWASATRAEASVTLQNELKTDGAYQALSARVMARADQRARFADVRGFEQILLSVHRGDAALGGKRPDAVTGLLAAVEAKLDAARQLRLERDRWEMRLPELRKYWTAITEPIDLFGLFGRMKPALEDIKSLAGSTPGTLAATDRVMMQIIKRASTILPPEELRPAHALIVSAAQLADSAAAIRREATLSGNIARAWDASSAAAGALLLSARARSEIQALLHPPELR
jgi:hypothetical protein